MKNAYVAIDIETTGLNPARDRILEVGAVKVQDGVIVDTYESFIDAGIRITPQIQKLTGITDEMIKNGKPLAQVLSETIAFCEDLPLLGHNILFDFSFIKRNAVNHNLKFEKEGIDTLKIARKLLPDLEKRSLEFLCNYYKVEQEKKHRALCDALSAKEIYECMQKEFVGTKEEVFAPKELHYVVKKQGPITMAQKGYLNDLVKYHRIDLDVRIDSLTKNEASRMIDHIILNKGRILR